MSSGKKNDGVREIWGFLKDPFHRNRSRSPSLTPSPSPSPSPTARPALSNTSTPVPDTTSPTNVISGSGTVTDNGITSTWPTDARDQSQNPQSPTISMPVRNEAFQKAIQEYINNLSDDDKVAFHSATDVMEKIEEMQKSKSRITPTQVQKMKKALQCVKQFLGSVIICIQHSPEISTLVVGGLNCILTLMLGHIQFFENLTDMMQRIGGHLTYLAKYATGIAFQNSDEVQEALVAVYCDLLGFYVKVRKLFTPKEGKLSYVQCFKRFIRVIWEPFEMEFQSIETRFIHNTTIVVRSAGVEHQLDFYQKEIRDKQRQEDDRLDEKRRVLRWLSPDDFGETHESHLRKRFQGTGQWLLDDPHFISWRDEAQSRLLWCYGAPGSGKTVLASLVIDHLSTCYELSTNVGTTYIYCNYAQSRSPLQYIRIAMKQLCRRMRQLPSQLHKVYKQHYQNDSQPGFQELKDIFLATIQQFDSVFLVLDALDECTETQRADLCQFFAGIIEHSACTGHGLVKFFVASRKEPDIERAFLRKAFPTIEVEAKKVDSDIKLYVTAQIEQRLDDGSLTLTNIMLKDKILTTLTSNAGGMFLWVEFQLKAILAQVSDLGIEETLTHIPKDMDSTYERILDIIDNKPPPQRELARKALLFVAYARKPVTIDNLALAIAAGDHTLTPEMLRSSISTEQMILDACGNLLSIHTDFRLARFVHFSVHEFLTNKPSKFLHNHVISYEYKAAAHRELAKMCIKFHLILYSRVQDGCTPTEESFARYILSSLPYHLLAGNLNSLPVNDPMVDLTLLFFDGGPPMLGPNTPWQFGSRDGGHFLIFPQSVLSLIFNLPATYQSYNPKILCDYQVDEVVVARVYGSFHRIVSDIRFAMHYAVGRLDSLAVCQRLYTHGYPIGYFFDAPSNLGVPSVCGLTPLYLVKSEEVARFLLDKGVSVNSSVVELPNLLGHVARCGDTKIIQLLLDHGAEQEKEALGSALQSIAYDGKVEAMRLLLDKGVDVNTQGDKYGNALQAASYKGNIEAMQLLLNKGADVNAQGGEYGNAIQAAAYDGNIEAIQLLLNNGADVNAQGGTYGNALQAAAYKGSVEAIQLLLNKGANVNAQGGEYGNALTAAAYGGSVPAMDLLLSKGADFNAQGWGIGNLLRAVSWHGRVEAMQFLLDKGVDVKVQGDNALLVASLCHNVEAIRLLLDQGADVNAQGGYYGNALQAVALSGKVEVICLLLKKGADVNAQGGKYGSALQAAAYNSHIEAMQCLLNNGADINALGGKYGSSLQAVAAVDDGYKSGWRGLAVGDKHRKVLPAGVAVGDANVEALRLLLHTGADTNAKGGYYCNALQAAAFSGNTKSMDLLLGARADVNAQGGEYGSALQAAARKGHIEAMHLLLDAEADVNAQGGRYGNALQAATYKGNVKAMQLLLNKGADVNAPGGEFGNALTAAAAKGNIEAINLLLDHGVTVDVGGGSSGNALQTATRNFDILQLLLEKGADVRAQGGYLGNALQAATLQNNVKAMQLLLDKGADVNAQGGYFGNALQAATCQNNVKAMQLLLDSGADVNAQCGEFSNAFQTAALTGKVSTMQYLLDQGAQINAQGGKFSNALQAAAYGGRVSAMRFLLDKGLDANAQGGMYGNALQAAASNGSVQAMRLLLDKGANVHAQGGYYGNSLQAAASRGNVEAIGLLLDKGADVNVQGGEYGSALQAAAGSKSYSAIRGFRLLLGEGADVNAQGGVYGNALQAAAHERNVEAIWLLLNKGADVNAQGGKYGTALQAALDLTPFLSPEKNAFDVAQILLDHGADVTAYVPGSKFGDAISAAKTLLRHDKANLAMFMKLFESKGWKRCESGASD